MISVYDLLSYQLILNTVSFWNLPLPLARASAAASVPVVDEPGGQRLFVLIANRYIYTDTYTYIYPFFFPLAFQE